MPEVTIVIVTYNSISDINNCLNSIYKFTPGTDTFEIIVIDNASEDDTAAAVRNYCKAKSNISLICNAENRGYTKANNQGIEASKGKFIFLLNPDIIFVESSIDILISRMKEIKADAIAPQLINPDWTVQPSCRTFPKYRDILFEFLQFSMIFRRNKFLSRWKMEYFGHDHEMEVEQPMAAALLIKTEVLKKIGNFDERFVMFFNDVDLCKKIYDSGFKIYFTAATKMIHLKGTSVYKDRKRMIKIWNVDCLSYFKKYYDNLIPYNLLKAGLFISSFVRK